MSSHLPTSSSREIVILFGSLTTVDPGNIRDTLDDCVKEKVAVSFIALAAEMKICRDFAEKTGGKHAAANVTPSKIWVMYRKIWCGHE